MAITRLRERMKFGSSRRTLSSVIRRIGIKNNSPFPLVWTTPITVTKLIREITGNQKSIPWVFSILNKTERLPACIITIDPMKFVTLMI
jgi:hypothetical protein